MIPHIRHYALLTLMLSLFALRSAACAEPASLPLADRSALMLNNGEVLLGTVSRVGDYYLVSSPTGEMRVRARDIEHHAASLDAAYRFRRERVSKDDVRGILELVRWSIRQQLYGYAASDLARADSIDPDHPLLGRLTRQLEVARTQRVREKEQDALATQPTNDVLSSSDNVAVVRRRGGIPSDEELASHLEAIPESMVHRFKTTVQPLLANRCATAGCHVPRSKNAFFQVRPSLNRTVTRRATLRNLDNVLNFVDVEDPGASDLLEFAARPHGGMDEAVFAGRNEFMLQLLASWVGEFQVEASDGSAPDTVETFRTAQLHAVRGTAGMTGRREVTSETDRVSELPRGADPRDGDTPHVSPNFPADSRSGEGRDGESRLGVGDEDVSEGVNRGESGDRSATGGEPRRRLADPFDPEVFNRRYSRRAVAATSKRDSG